MAREKHLDVLVAQALGLLAAIAILKARRLPRSKRDLNERPAQLLGFVEARLAEFGTGTSLTPFGEALARAHGALRERMSPNVIAGLMADGADMTEEQAFDAAGELVANRQLHVADP